MKNPLRRREAMAGFAFVFPSFFLLCVFIAVPIVKVFYYALTEYNGAKEPIFVGLRNFAKIVQDKSIRYALRNTVVYTFVCVPVLTMLSLTVATILAQNFQNKFGGFVRSSLFIPVICSATLVATIWYYLFSSDPNGLMNTLASWFGLEPIDWLGKEKLALAIICFVMVWKELGYYLVIYYAAIMDIPKTQFEAAAIDGATKFQQFWHITIPNLKSTSALVVTLCTINSFQVFDLAYNMTMGGPGYATTSLVFRVYVESFKNWKLGYGCAIAVMMLAIIAAVSFVQRRLFQEKVN